MRLGKTHTLISRERTLSTHEHASCSPTHNCIEKPILQLPQSILQLPETVLCLPQSILRNRPEIS